MDMFTELWMLRLLCGSSATGFSIVCLEQEPFTVAVFAGSTYLPLIPPTELGFIFSRWIWLARDYHLPSPIFPAAAPQASDVCTIILSIQLYYLRYPSILLRLAFLVAVWMSCTVFSCSTKNSSIKYMVIWNTLYEQTIGSRTAYNQ